MKTLGVIPKHYPTSLLTKIALFLFLGVVAGGSFLYYSSHVLIGGSYLQGLKTIITFKQLIIKKSILIYLLASVFILIGIVVLTVLYSHRVAGPLYRLSVSAKRITEGDLTLKVRLRERDALHPLADSFNELTEAYRRRIIHLKDAIQQIKGASESVDRAIREEQTEELQRAIDELSERVRNLKDDLEEIKI
ncbi:MAG: methyl-accepting chemotaxis protein [Nitrospirae bacterium]|nr:MAG: methyl-accepting chemotaxis protein [Nitrospirota bacterium]